MFFKVTSFLFLGVGVFLLVQVILPVMAYKFREVTFLRRDLLLVDPGSIGRSVAGRPRDILGVSVENVGNFPAIVSKAKKREGVPYREFTVSVPSIGLVEARVVVESNSFDESLAHLPGSVLPGERGNVFITGHSSLTQLFREGNYKAIFANLPKVRRGDEIEVIAAGQKFRYLVEGLKLVDPKDISVIDSPDSRGRYLTLMTCVPPGLSIKRLVVLAKLV